MEGSSLIVALLHVGRPHHQLNPQKCFQTFQGMNTSLLGLTFEGQNCNFDILQLLYSPLIHYNLWYSSIQLWGTKSIHTCPLLRQQHMKVKCKHALFLACKLCKHK